MLYRHGDDLGAGTAPLAVLSLDALRLPLLEAADDHLEPLQPPQADHHLSAGHCRRSARHLRHRPLGAARRPERPDQRRTPQHHHLLLHVLPLGGVRPPAATLRLRQRRRHLVLPLLSDHLHCALHSNVPPEPGALRLDGANSRLPRAGHFCRPLCRYLLS